jgi:uncharacterized protein YjbJ (UPF0337 family)
MTGDKAQQAAGKTRYLVIVVVRLSETIFEGNARKEKGSAQQDLNKPTS